MCTLPGCRVGRERRGRCGGRLIDQRCAAAPFQYVRSVHIHYLTATIRALTYYVAMCIGSPI